jgi:hypothetical protein
MQNRVRAMRSLAWGRYCWRSEKQSSLKHKSAGMIPFMLRITATSLVLAAMALIAAGCGRSAHVSASNAQVLAFAGAVNLRSTDVPELRVARSNALLPPQGGGGSTSCAGGTGVRPILSRAFVARRWETFSYVVAMSSEASAESYVSALDTPKGRSCFVPEVQSSPPPSVTRLSATLPAGQRYVGVRTVTSPDGRSEGLHIDTFLFAAGPTVVGLVALSGNTAPPRSAERRLLSLLDSRARAHRL